MSEGDWRYTKLNPCPKCKQQPIFDADECEIRCEDCNIYFSAGTLDEIVTGWNEYTDNPLELELDKAVREHVEGVRNDNV